MGKRKNLTQNEARESLERQIADLCDSLYNLGFDVGGHKASQHIAALREQSSVVPSTADRKASYENTYGETLHGWCLKCKRQISGRWGHLWDYCPWCGRRISKLPGRDYIDYDDSENADDDTKHCIDEEEIKNAVRGNFDSIQKANEKSKKKLKNAPIH